MAGGPQRDVERVERITVAGSLRQEHGLERRGGDAWGSPEAGDRGARLARGRQVTGSGGWGAKPEVGLGALERFNREMTARTQKRALEVHPHMEERWDCFRRGLRGLLESNDEMSLSPASSQERTERWVLATVHRIFAAPLSALMHHEQGVQGAEKKRFAEMTDVLKRMFDSDVSSVVPLPRTPADMASEAWLGVNPSDIVGAVKTVSCFRCGANDTSGSHFTSVCGASYDQDRNALGYRARPSVSWAEGKSGQSRATMGGVRGTDNRQELAADVEVLVAEAIRKRDDETRPPRSEGARDRAGPTRYRSRTPPLPSRYTPRDQLPGASRSAAHQRGQRR